MYPYDDLNLHFCRILSLVGIETDMSSKEIVLQYSTHVGMSPSTSQAICKSTLINSR